ncbi:MAG: SIR2 family protein [Hyphomonadaceae bacterium]
MEKRFRLFVLGAGFSKAAGLPLANELWAEVRKRARLLDGRAARFARDLRSYIEFKRRTEGIEFNDNDVPFEAFMEYLDLEHFLGMRGSDTWSDDGNETTILVKHLISQILVERLLALPEIPSAYLEFARRLQPDDIVFTFNYDTLLERACDAVGTPYRLSLTTYSEVVGDSCTVARDEAVSILKVHGSIDWFSRRHFDEMTVITARFGGKPASHPIFSNSEELDVVPVVAGAVHPSDPMRSVYRVRNLPALHGKQTLFHATPHILPPSPAKFVYGPRMNNYWDGIDKAGVLNFGMAIIGYSLPDEDRYAKQILYELITNYQTQYWGKEVFGIIKTPVVLVDLFDGPESRKSYKRRYQFVDWERCHLFGEGFNFDKLDDIFIR